MSFLIKAVESWGFNEMALRKGVFLCHNTKDKPEIHKIRNLLKRRKISTFMDQYDFIHFNLWEDQLISEIKSFETAAIFLGKSGLGPWQAKEIELFLSEYKKNTQYRRLGLVLLPGCSQQLLNEVMEKWPDLGRWQWTNFDQDDPDPVEALILGIQPDSLKSELSHEEKLEIKKENRKLRADVFQVVANDFQEEAKRLLETIEREKARIRIIDKEISQIVLNLKNIAPEIKSLEKNLRRRSGRLAKLSAKLVFDGNSQFQGREDSIEFKESVDWFHTEIENYIGRICGFLITSKGDVLEDLMRQRSGFEPETYIRALKHIRELVHSEFDSAQEALEVFDKGIKILCKAIKFQM
jgi:hypothetical protein